MFHGSSLSRFGASGKPGTVHERRDGRHAGAHRGAGPVVLPGYDSLRGRPRPERSVRRLLRHAGVAESLVAGAAYSRGSRLSFIIVAPAPVASCTRVDSGRATRCSCSTGLTAAGPRAPSRVIVRVRLRALVPAWVAVMGTACPPGAGRRDWRRSLGYAADPLRQGLVWRLGEIATGGLSSEGLQGYPRLMPRSRFIAALRRSHSE